jgi:hypothetical protein
VTCVAWKRDELVLATCSDDMTHRLDTGLREDERNSGMGALSLKGLCYEMTFFLEGLNIKFVHFCMSTDSSYSFCLPFFMCRKLKIKFLLATFKPLVIMKILTEPSSESLFRLS